MYIRVCSLVCVKLLVLQPGKQDKIPTSNVRSARKVTDEKWRVNWVVTKLRKEKFLTVLCHVDM